MVYLPVLVGTEHHDIRPFAAMVIKSGSCISTAMRTADRLLRPSCSETRRRRPAASATIQSGPSSTPPPPPPRSKQAYTKRCQSDANPMLQSLSMMYRGTEKVAPASNWCRAVECRQSCGLRMETQQHFLAQEKHAQGLHLSFPLWKLSTNVSSSCHALAPVGRADWRAGS